MRFQAVVFSAVLAGASSLCFAQFSNIPGYPASNGPMGEPGQASWNSAVRNVNSISGSVRSVDNQPVDNVRVELRDGSTGAIISASYTGSRGDFEFRQLRQGPYEVIATSGAARAEESIQVNSTNTNVDLTLAVNKKPTDGIPGNTVSVNQYRIPEGAREELRKAHQASEKGKMEDAWKHVGRALEIHPGYAEALSLRAAFKLDKADAAGAVEDAQKAIDTDGNYGLAYTVMGSAMNLQKKYDEALRSLQRAQTLSPDAWQTYFEIGRAYAGKGDYSNAIQALDRAAKLAPPDYSLLRLIRAHCLMALGRNSEAASELQAYLQKNPNGARGETARKMLAQAQAAMGNASN